MSHARTIWEEGREPGGQLVALGLAVALTVAVVDLAVTDGVSLLFDLGFAVLCVALALLVAPRDFFVVGVLPPLLMLTVFVLLAFARPGAIPGAHDNAVQAVINGLSHHSVALFVGYALCLGCLAMRRKVASRR